MNPTDTTVAETELVKKMEGKSVEERAALMTEFAAREYGAKPQSTAPSVALTDDQFDKLIGRSVEETKKGVTELADKIERKFALDAGQARAIADDTIGKELRSRSTRNADCVEAAKVFRAIARSATNRAKPGELDAARDEERSYLQSTGREVRNMDVGTSSEGAVLAPEIWNTMLYENLARTSILRQDAYWFEMESNIMRLPKLTANVTANTVPELSAANPSQPTFAQATWTLKKLSVLTNPFSIELFENARPELVQMLTNVAMVELNRKEDEVCFNTTDSAWTDMLDSTTGRYYLGGSSSSGKTNANQITFDDCAGAIFSLAEQYVPDADVSGSGIISGGEAKFYVNKSVIQNLLALKGTTNQYIWGNVQDLQSGRSIYGHTVRRALSLPATATAATQFAAFGNLKYKWVGHKPGFFIDVLKEATIGGVNLATTSSYALRISELLDIQTVDDNAFARLSTSAT